MEWKKMSFNEAKSVVDEIEKKSVPEFNNLVAGWEAGNGFEEIDGDYKNIRDAIVKEYLKYKSYNGYEIDLRVGLALYDLFLKDEYNLTPIYANDDDIWRYLSVRVFLDITYLREPHNDRFGPYFSHDRVYRHTKRIWIKQLWWFVHLAWQGSSESTYEVLKKYGSGCISQILERAGKGYRKEITRELLKKIAERVSTKVSQDDFRALMMLYYAKMFVVEPTLADGGTESFLTKLINEKL